MEPEVYTPPPPIETRITNYAFDMRFTLEERINIDLASIDDPNAPMETRRLASRIRVQKERAAKAEFTDLADHDTRVGVMLFEAGGLLEYEGRAAEILDAPVQLDEIPSFLRL